MTDVFSLLTLPRTSNAFSALSSQPQALSSTSSRSASPPRKIPRLDGASDTHSASASSSHAGASQPAEKRGPIILRVIGHPVKPTPTSLNDSDYGLLRRVIRTLLDPSETAELSASATYERISRACRVVVSEAGKGEDLYDVVKVELQRCVGTVESLLVNETRRSVEWLVPFTEACAWFEKQVSLLQSLLAYLDTLYVAEKTSLPGTKRLAYTLFTDRVIRSPAVTALIMEGLADWLQWERTNMKPHDLRPYLPQLVRHMCSHGIYAMVEIAYLDFTKMFYTKESQELVDSGISAKDFLIKTSSRVREEASRAEEVLLDVTVAPVKNTSLMALITERLQWLAQDALKHYLTSEDKKWLAGMYNMFSEVDGLKVLCAAFKAHLQQSVKEIVTDTANDEEMVPRLLKLKAFADGVVSTVFVQKPTAPAQPIASTSTAAQPEAPLLPNREFSYALTDAFRAGFKARRIKPAEMIAKYMDKAMRRGQKGKADEVFANELNQVLALYRFTDDMDVFRTFYKRALARRLLLGRSASDDFEKAVLKKLQTEYDNEFEVGEDMFKDLELSRDMMKEFLERAERHGGAKTLQSMSVMVLKRSAWPFAARKTDIDLPRWMQDDLATYLTFYNKQHQGHKLDWDHALGTATLKARFRKGDKELSVSLYQAVILLLFNEGVTLSYQDIKDHTRLDDTELQRTLQSLACGKKRVLRKEPVGKDVKKTDVFHFNADFTDERYHVHINSIQVKETAEETKRTQTSIEQDRKHTLDAAIVRVMKGKKELTYEQLKTATIEAVKRHFVPEVSMIKKRIEDLVEQEYLRRDEDDLNKYFYVA